MTEAAAPTAREAGPAQPVPRALVVLSLGLLAILVVIEILAGPALTPSPERSHQAQVLALPGVSGMLHGSPVDPSEVTQVAAGQHQPSPLALPAQALLDGLLLVSVAALVRPRFRPGPDAPGRTRLAPFLGSLAVLLVGIAVAVVAIARLRFLVALYLSPPWGTLSYLLLYGSFSRRSSLLVLTAVMALKVGVILLVPRSFPTAGQRGVAGLALTSVAATVVATFGYALAPTSLASIADALVAATVALAAVGWAGVIVSGSVRRLA